MSQPEDRRAPPEDNPETLGTSAEEKLEVTSTEKPNSAETGHGNQTVERVKDERDEENTRKRKRNIEEDVGETSRKHKVDIGEEESQARDSNVGPVIVQGSFIWRGIKNVSETCFLNVALQCLLAMDNIRERYVKPSDQISDPNFITYQISKFLAQRCSMMGSPDFHLLEPSPSEAPSELHNKLYPGQEKNHAGVTILKIVNGLDEENDRSKVQEGSEMRPLMEDFTISFQTKVTCSSCGHEFSLAVENEGMLDVMNLTDDEVSRYPQLRGKWLQRLGDDGQKWLKLEDLLPFIGSQEKKNTLSNCCSKCKFEVSIEKAPRVLVIAWMAEVRPSELDLLSNQIEFEKYLDLSKFAAKNPLRLNHYYKYRLIAVADLQGPVEYDPTKPVVGHTSVFVLGSKYDEVKWIHFNDDVVTHPIEEDQVLNATHWVSVYERENNQTDMDLNKKLPDVDETGRVEVDLNKFLD